MSDARRSLKPKTTGATFETPLQLLYNPFSGLIVIARPEKVDDQRCENLSWTLCEND